MKETEMTCVKHHDICMHLRSILGNGSLGWPEHALPRIWNACIIENRPSLH
ncbi:hypothetical protein PCO31110_02087 [Pandoraea communis]|uniref:Uncharacterized protein n=1 Tax=Pandoraea communis TaxID=2508297 RepID=A0A5E4UIY5_9BURK|nr:hypothetical protein PCO31110_02087 [Pandoraea communis]